MVLKVVYRPADEFLAQSLKDLLEQNGIVSVLRSYQIPAYDGIARMMRPNWGELLVEESDLEQARDLVDGFLGSQEREAEQPDAQE